MTRARLQQVFISLFFMMIPFTTLFITYSLLRPALAFGPSSGGSKLRVNDEKIGPYTLLVATAPLPVTVEQMSVWVRVTESKTSSLRRDALVTIEATPRGGGPALTAQGTHQNAGNDYDYAAHLPVEQAGQWDVTVYAEDEPDQVQVSLTETVTRGMSPNVLVGKAILYMVLTVIVGVYLWRRSATAQKP